MSITASAGGASSVSASRIAPSSAESPGAATMPSAACAESASDLVSAWTLLFPLPVIFAMETFRMNFALLRSCCESISDCRSFIAFNSSLKFGAGCTLPEYDFEREMLSYSWLNAHATLSAGGRSFASFDQHRLMIFFTGGGVCE
eukprot:31175-Pelagococcus_subviridis.AAC.10